MKKKETISNWIKMGQPIYWRRSEHIESYRRTDILPFTCTTNTTYHIPHSTQNINWSLSLADNEARCLEWEKKQTVGIHHIEREREKNKSWSASYNQSKFFSSDCGLLSPFIYFPFWLSAVRAAQFYHVHCEHSNSTVNAPVQHSNQWQGQDSRHFSTH